MSVIIPEIPSALLFFIFLTAKLTSSDEGANSKDAVYTGIKGGKYFCLKI